MRSGICNGRFPISMALALMRSVFAQQGSVGIPVAIATSLSLLSACAVPATPPSPVVLPTVEEKPFEHSSPLQTRDQFKVPRAPGRTTGAFSVAWSPKGDHLVAGVCRLAKDRLWAADGNCTLLRYSLGTQTFHGLPKLPSTPTWEYENPVFMPDGQHIVATERGPNCSPEVEGCGKTQKVGWRLVLLKLDGERERYLSGHNMLWLMPSVSKDGKTLLAWNARVLAGSQGVFPFWDVWELDIATGRSALIVRLGAEYPQGPPRYWHDGRIMVVASHYPVANNPLYGGKSYYDVHGSNYTLVLNRSDPRPRIWPYFEEVDPPEMRKAGQSPTRGKRGVLVDEITKDGKHVIYQDSGLVQDSGPSEYNLVIRRVDDRSDFGRRVPITSVLNRMSLSPDDERLGGILPGKDIAIIDVNDGKTAYIRVDW